MLTYFLSQNIGLNSVLSSCLITLVFSFIPVIRKDKFALAYCYMGSFIGMTSFSVSLLEFTIISFVALLLTLFSHNLFKGFGGKLGSIAYVSSFMYLHISKSIL